MLRLVKFKIAHLVNRFAMLLLTRSVTSNKPVAWHRRLFHHYMILIPSELTLMAEMEVLRKVMKAIFPYFLMAKTHEDMFMEEFYTFLMDNRKEMYTNLYKISTDLDGHKIDQRIRTIELIYRDFFGIELIENLRLFFSEDMALSYDHQIEIQQSLASVLAVSISVGWGHETHSLGT